MKQAKVWVAAAAAAACMAVPGWAQRGEPFQATVRGSGDSGKCTIEVRVDDVAEVEVRGTTGYLRTLAGQPAEWKRFVCNAPFPTGGMQEFKFKGIDGRGRVDLRRDPRDNRGVAVIYIVDNKGGAEGYTFDLEWKGGYLDSNPGRGGWGGGERGGNNNNNNNNNRGNRDNGGFFGNNSGDGGRSGGFFGGDNTPVQDSVRNCQNEISNRLGRDGYSNIGYTSGALSDRPGKTDWISGAGRAYRSGTTSEFEYACQMDLNRSQVKRVDYRVR